jgi:CRISPR-associated protein Csm1
MTEFNQREYRAVILGALLHDTGKFVQRAQINPKSQDHSHWGEDWLQNNLAEKLTPVFNESEKQIIRSAISNHHFSEKYISLADAISAGMDRIELEDEEKGDPFTDRLISIFSRISISDTIKKDMYHELIPLGESRLKEIFPIDNKKCSYEEYPELLYAFKQEIRSMDISILSPRSLIECLYFLLWKYTWCIPSSTYKDEPDVSLFDHLKTTAAIAGCLYAYQKENSVIKLDLESKAFCLIGGDISGIQNYIFEVLTQQGKVAKRLRARSLFVQFISEIASHKILHAFNLTLCNLIGSAGGNFYILLPNLKETANKIKEMQKEFDDWTLTHLKGELSISLASVELCGKDLSNFSKILNEKLKYNLNLKKYQPHKLVLSDNDRWSEEKFLFQEIIEGDEKVCQGCRKNPRAELEQNEDNLCIHCLTDINIGQSLPKAKYVAFFKDRLHEHEVLNYSFELWNEKDFNNRSHKESYLILSLNSTEVRPPIIGFKYLATYIPFDKENQPITLND